MSRRNISRKQHAEIELFPFLSILACTIGTLILLIIVLTTQTLNKQQEVTIVAKVEGENGAKKGENAVNKTKTPRYIECHDDGVLIYPSETFVPRANLQDANSPLLQLISKMKANKDKEYLIVALRPDGIDMFNQIRDLVKNQGIDIGYEPVDFGWKLITKPESKKVK